MNRASGPGNLFSQPLSVSQPCCPTAVIMQRVLGPSSVQTTPLLRSQSSLHDGLEQRSPDSLPYPAAAKLLASKLPFLTHRHPGTVRGVKVSGGPAAECPQVAPVPACRAFRRGPAAPPRPPPRRDHSAPRGRAPRPAPLRAAPRPRPGPASAPPPPAQGPGGGRRAPCPLRASPLRRSALARSLAPSSWAVVGAGGRCDRPGRGSRRRSMGAR